MSNLSQVQELLSQLSIDQIEKVCKDAKSLAARNKRKEIPSDEIERLNIAYRRLKLGQKISYTIDVPIKFDFKISAQYEYGGFEEIDIEFLTHKCKPHKDSDSPGIVWVEFLKDLWQMEAGLLIGEQCATGVDKKIATACDEESAVYKDFQKLSRDFEEKYGVDTFEFIK